MSVEVIIGPKKIVYCAPVNNATQKWGVYCIPRLWRLQDGTLVIRFNGEQDTFNLNELNIAKNLYYISKDDGETWEFDPDGEQKYDTSTLLGIGSPFVTLPNGNIIAFKDKDNCKPIKNTKHQKEFIFPNGGSVYYTYKYGDIPEECKGLEMLTYKTPTSSPEISKVELNFDEREIYVNAMAITRGEHIPVEQYIRPFFCHNPYITGLNVLSNGELVALSGGQNPKVFDRYCSEVYLMVSNDNGLTWEKRSTVASDDKNVPYGYGGDAIETSLCLAKNGDLICAMRMDLSIDPKRSKPICDTMLAISHDNGYTWDAPFSVSDSSITPQVISLDNGIIVVAYGRPGVHFKYSEDFGKTWSDSYSIIGLTLEQERAIGRDDSDSKYFDTCSYSNLFIEKISEDSFIVLTTDLKYDDGDGQNHKAGFIRKITLKNNS